MEIVKITHEYENRYQNNDVNLYLEIIEKLIIYSFVLFNFMNN